MSLSDGKLEFFFNILMFYKTEKFDLLCGMNAWSRYPMSGTIKLDCGIQSSIWSWIWDEALISHSYMQSPLAPDPIRVQSCVCCLFWTNRNSMAVTSIFLSISLSNQSYESFNQKMEIYSSTETIVLMYLVSCAVPWADTGGRAAGE